MSGRLLTESRPTELWDGLEKFHRLGVTPEDWKRFRTDEAHAKKVVATLQNQPPILTPTANGGITFARPTVPDPKLFREEMAEFYGQEYGIIKLPKVSLPEVREGFCWGLIMLPGLTMEQDLTPYAQQSKLYRWTNEDLDKIVTSVRSAAKKPYAVWFHDRIEADQEHANKSANNLQVAKINGITLPERIRLERWFGWKTGGQHLDIQNITYCTGSRDSDGIVPSVDWGGYYDELLVSYYSPDYASGSLRTREAVS